MALKSLKVYSYIAGKILSALLVFLLVLAPVCAGTVSGKVSISTSGSNNNNNSNTGGSTSTGGTISNPNVTNKSIPVTLELAVLNNSEQAANTAQNPSEAAPAITGAASAVPLSAFGGNAGLIVLAIIIAMFAMMIYRGQKKGRKR